MDRVITAWRVVFSHRSAMIFRIWGNPFWKRYEIFSEFSGSCNWISSSSL